MNNAFIYKINKKSNIDSVVYMMKRTYDGNQQIVNNNNNKSAVLLLS